MRLRAALVLLFVPLIASYQFTTDNWNSFDAYGVKLAANDLTIVEARNSDGQFIVQIGPFNTSNLSVTCYINYPSVGTNNTNFIYSVVVPRNTDHVSIVFIGENDANSMSPGPFVGHVQVDSTCNASFDIQLFGGYGHEEFYVIGIDPTGEMAYGFSTQFAFSYDLNTHSVNQLLPISNFAPHAIDVNSGHVSVIAGFVMTAPSTYRPLIHMVRMNSTSLNIIDTWVYVPTSNSWQALTLNRDAATFTAKHIMSVSIHNRTSQVLVGMPSMNTIFWFNMTTNLQLLSKRENGLQYGFGQSVAWSDTTDGLYAMILGNAYSYAYKWLSSNIYRYSLETLPSTDSILPFFPTTQQPLWIEFGPEYLSIATTTFDLAIVDSVGQVYVILATTDGFYPSTNYVAGINPVFSDAIPCPAGMQKSSQDIEVCSLCAVGSMSDSDGNVKCTPYTCNDTNLFCPLGSVINDTYSDLMISISQSEAYPRSPASTIFDDILIENMFSVGSSTHCIIVSPFFWTMVMTGIVFLILLLMGVLKVSIRFANIRLTIKKIFRQIDLIKEGELWVGGLASFALIVLLVFAYIFSYSYLQEYPIETASEFSFACDTSMRNAKFDTSVQSRGTPLLSTEQPIFDLLDEQQFMLTVDFVNTRLECNDVKVIEIAHQISKHITSICVYNRSVLSVSISLDSHTKSVSYEFSAVRPIGGLRISFYSSEKENNKDTDYYYIARELKFSQAFYMYNRTLAPDPAIEFNLTRVVNKTDPLASTGQQRFSALWIPSSQTNVSDLFLTLEQFLYYGLLQPTLNVSISEMTYFVFNVQQPIAQSSEVIFHNLLFTIVCLELFGLVFLMVKLLFMPFFTLLHRFIAKHSNIIHPELLTSQSNPTPINTISIEKPNAPVVLPTRQRAMVFSLSTATKRPMNKRMWYY